MGLYLLKSAACLLLCFAFYKIALERLALHTFKRFYLLGSVVLSLVIPLITFKTYVASTLTETLEVAVNTSAQVGAPIPSLSGDYGMWALWGLYGMGVLFFALKFIKNLWALLLKIRKSPKVSDGAMVYVLLPHATVPHAFFNYVFVSEADYKTHALPREVLEHEMVHAQQGHTLDLLVMELAMIVFWFNPLLYFYKRAIRLNHEFLADHRVLSRGADRSTYQQIILAFSSQAQTPSLAHAFHYSSIKKRFTLMKTHTSRSKLWLLALLLVPLFAVLLYGFSSQKEVLVASEKAPISKDKKILVYVHKKKVEVNGQSVTVEQFASTIDGLTKDWSEADMKAFQLDLFFDKADDETVRALQKEYQKTKLYQVNPTGFNTLDIPPPPPPAPDAPEAPEADEAPEMDSTPPKPDQVAAYGPAEDPATVIRGYILNGAEFFMDGKPIPPDEAMKWIRFEPGFRIEVDSSDPKKYKVSLIGC